MCTTGYSMCYDFLRKCVEFMCFSRVTVSHCLSLAWVRVRCSWTHELNTFAQKFNAHTVTYLCVCIVFSERMCWVHVFICLLLSVISLSKTRLHISTEGQSLFQNGVLLCAAHDRSWEVSLWIKRMCARLPELCTHCKSFTEMKALFCKISKYLLKWAHIFSVLNIKNGWSIGTSQVIRCMWHSSRPFRKQQEGLQSTHSLPICRGVTSIKIGKSGRHTRQHY